MTRDELRHLFESLHLHDRHIIVHAALSAVGDMTGGARAVCDALVGALGSGTLLMPAFTYAETLIGYRAGRTVVFNPDLPVSKEIGAIAEDFRRFPGVLRSNHPTHSFVAHGRSSRDFLSTQRDNNLLGPIKKLNIAQGFVVLLGAGLHSATAVHLAEEQLPVPYLDRRSAMRLNSAGYEERVVLENVPGCSVAFDRLEERLDPKKVLTVALPNGIARRIPIRYLVTLAAQALAEDPTIFICDRLDCTSCAGKRSAMTGHKRRA